MSTESPARSISGLCLAALIRCPVSVIYRVASFIQSATFSDSQFPNPQSLYLCVVSLSRISLQTKHTVGVSSEN